MRLVHGTVAQAVILAHVLPIATNRTFEKASTSNVRRQKSGEIGGQANGGRRDSEDAHRALTLRASLS